MDDFKRFESERRCVSNKNQLVAFRRKWFPEDDWPLLSKPDEWAEVAAQAQRNRELAESTTGRVWAAKMCPYALEPEARYEVFRTEAMLLEVTFPSEPNQEKKVGPGAYSLSCDFCLIAMLSEGSVLCPICGREMMYGWSGG